jgi:hypothetical protein
MNKIILTLLVLASISIKAQVGIGTANPDVSAILDVTSTAKGMLIPKMTQAQRLAIVVGASTTGLLVYQTDAVTGFWYYTGAAWSQFGGVASGWGITGNAGTTPATNKLGTTDAQPLVVKTNNTEALRILSDGKVGIGNTAPSAALQVQNPVSTAVAYGFEVGGDLAAFTTNGSGGVWTTTVAAGTFFAGATGLQSGTGVTSGVSSLTYSAYIPTGGCNVTFRYKTSSENTDKLKFYIDGVLQSQWGGLTAWTLGTFPLTSGLHTLRWSYEKDGSINSNADRVYLDDISLTILPPSKSLRIEDGNQANNFVLKSDASGNGIWTDPNTLATADDDWRFNSGSAYTDPLYRTGSVQIGNPATDAGSLLCIHNNNSLGSEFGWGDVEYLMDGNVEFFASHSLVPAVDNSISLGTLAWKWGSFWAASIVTTSDKREKEHIKPLTYGLSTLMKLNPVSYYWKKEQYGKNILEDKDKRKKIGFIAQELKEVLPETVQSLEWVPKSEKEPNTYIKKEVDTLGVCYSEILPVVIKSTQEHQQTLDDIKKQQENLIALIKKAEKK